MRIVVALGGNALLERGDKPDALIQRRHIRRAARLLAPLTVEHELVVSHGNGPQVGLLALESESDETLTEPYPLDALGAQTQGMIGYWLAQELRNAGVSRPIVSLITQTVVDPADAAFDHPTKFVGPVLTRPHAYELADRLRWSMSMDGHQWRRVVASPRPLRVIEMETINLLVKEHALVICGGGGGVPVADCDSGELLGLEAVVDKDSVTALIAAELHADRLVLLTDVDGVMQDFGTPSQRPLTEVDVDTLDAMIFAPGSMGPKVTACSQFVRTTGGTAAIGSLGQAASVINGSAGTQVSQGSKELMVNRDPAGS